MLNRPVLLYDGDCAFCTRWVDRLRRWDRSGRIDTVPAAERHGLPFLPAISDAELERAMHFVALDGQVHRGGRAVAEVARFLPSGRVAYPLLKLPGVSNVLDAGYRFVAARRHCIGCGSRGCHYSSPRVR